MDIRAALIASCTLLAACGAERPATKVISPAEPRPAKTTATFAPGPMITTSGSPPPPGQPQGRIERVTIRGGAIQARPNVPLGHSTFAIRNDDNRACMFQVLGADGGILSSMEIAPGGETMLAMDLRARRYRFHCANGGVRAATVETYEPR